MESESESSQEQLTQPLTESDNRRPASFGGNQLDTSDWGPIGWEEAGDQSEGLYREELTQELEEPTSMSDDSWNVDLASKQVKRKRESTAKQTTKKRQRNGRSTLAPGVFSGEARADDDLVQKAKAVRSWSGVCMFIESANDQIRAGIELLRSTKRANKILLQKITSATFQTKTIDDTWPLP